MQILVEVPTSLPDAMQCTPQQFILEAKMAMAVKLYEMKRLSSGMAASLVGMNRVQFLGELHRYGVAVIDLDDGELEEDIINA
jgi:predicted HTH domain antitoxin